MNGSRKEDNFSIEKDCASCQFLMPLLSGCFSLEVRLIGADRRQVDDHFKCMAHPWKRQSGPGDGTPGRGLVAEQELL